MKYDITIKVDGEVIFLKSAEAATIGMMRDVLEAKGDWITFHLVGGNSILMSSDMLRRSFISYKEAQTK